MNYTVNNTDRPVYLQIYRQIRDDITSGVFPYNIRLPSKRLLADELGVSTITVEHAYSLLCDEGYTESRERRLCFVGAGARSAERTQGTPRIVSGVPYFRSEQNDAQGHHRILRCDP